MDQLSATEVWVLVSVFSLVLLTALIINIALLRLISIALRDRLRYPRLRHFLASLAFTNLITSIVLLAVWLYTLVSSQLKDTGGPTKEISEVYYYSMDVFYGFLVILHIVVLMTERFFAIGWPIQHRIAPDLPDYIMCLVIWLISVAVSAVSCVVYHYLTFEDLILVIFITCFGIPTIAAAMLFLCILVRSKTRPRTASQQRDYTLALVIAWMLVAYVVACLPLHCVNFLSHYCTSCGINFITIMSLRCLQAVGGVIIPGVVLMGVTEFRTKVTWCYFKCCSIDEHSKNDLFLMEVPGMIQTTNSQCTLTRASANSVSMEQVVLSFPE